jgi:hypothetical protein
MDSIVNFLGKFSHFYQEQSQVKKIISDTVQKINGLSIPETAIEVKQEIIRLRVHPAILNEILLHKTTLLMEIEKQTKKKYRIIGLS